MSDSLWGDRFSGHDVMYVHRRVTSWMFIATRSGNLDDVTRHVLTFLSQNACHIGRGARAECDEQ
jgi:hypothetical protein